MKTELQNKEIRKWWVVYGNDKIHQFWAITLNSVEAILCKNREVEVKELGYAKYVLSTHARDWKHVSFLLCTREEIIDMMKKDDVADTTGLPPLDLYNFNAGLLK
jgi:hypothetical protein